MISWFYPYYPLTALCTLMVRPPIANIKYSNSPMSYEGLLVIHLIFTLYIIILYGKFEAAVCTTSDVRN